jgi:acetyl-CoA acyltransferase
MLSKEVNVGDVYIVSAVRTPVGRRNGYLRNWMVPQLLGSVLDAAVDRINLDPGLVEDVICGTVYQVGEQGSTLARTGVFASKLPDSVPGVSINRQCGSSLTAIQMAFGLIASNVMDVVIACGCEVMTKYPIMCDYDGTLPDGRPQGSPIGDYYMKRVKGRVYNQAQAAQAIAEKWDISEEECYAFSIQSHKKAHQATRKGYFENEIQPTAGVDKDGNKILVDKDETIRSDTTLEKMARLKPVLDTDWITAGISSPVSDGASAVVLMSEQMINELNLTPLARIVSNVVIGSDPVYMLTGPMEATPKVLKKAGLKMGDMDIFEVNEAFAPIPLAWGKELNAPMDRLNVCGGAIALGHPVGSSGCRLSITAIYELIRRNARYALVTLCTGGGMAPATIFERA